MGIEVRSWDVAPDMYDLSPASKSGVALQAVDTETLRSVGNVHVVPEAIAKGTVITAASLVLKLSASMRMLVQK